MSSRPVPPSVAVFVCALLLTTAAFMAFQSLALAADGSYYLVRILGTDDVFGPNGRLFANAVRQAPVLLAARAGVTDTHALSIYLGVGQLVLPAAIWSAAIALSRASTLAFAAVSMTAGLCLGMTYFFSVSESVLATALVALVGVLLWRPRAWNWAHATLAACASIVLVASYETAVATGALLAVWAGWRARQSSSTPDRHGNAVVGLASSASVVVAAMAATGGKGPSNARSSLYFVLSADPWWLYLALVGMAAGILASGWARASGARWALFGAGISCIAVAAAGMRTTSVAAFQARGGAVLGGFLLLLFLFWLWVQSRRANARRERAALEGSSSHALLAVTVLFIGAMLLVNLHGLRAWSRSLEAFRDEVDRVHGVARAADQLPPGRRQVVWDWTSSSLSLLVRGNADAGILVDRDPSFVPFPPVSARDQLGDEFIWAG